MIRFSNSQMSKKEMCIRFSAAFTTVTIGVVVLLIKFLAYNTTNSQSIYSDALESIVNVITALIGVAVIYYATQPVDEDHPYGHGKIEYFCSA